MPIWLRSRKGWRNSREAVAMKNQLRWYGKPDFAHDRLVLWLFALAAIPLAALSWLAEHPEHDPRAPLDLSDPPGWATQAKMLALKSDPADCRAVLDRSGVAFTALEPQGEGACARPDRTIVDALPLSPRVPPATCATGIALHIWIRDTVQPAARQHLGEEVSRVTHMGAYSCRRMYGREGGRWSEHATGNAIDIGGFVLSEGRTVSVLRDWDSDADEAEFLRAVRDGACPVFATVLSPDYNAAHRDHFHFDQSDRYRSVCR